MARLLVRLKLRLLTNALRSSTTAKVSFIVSTMFAVLVAAGTFAILAALRGTPTSVDLTTVLFTLFALGWLILPIFASALTPPSIRQPCSCIPFAPGHSGSVCSPRQRPAHGRPPTLSACWE